MNANVQADTFTFGLVASFVDVKVSTVSHILLPKHNTSVDAVCLSLFKFSVNGHSISAINPERSLIGGMTTSLSA